MIYIAPSLLAADFTRLGEEVQKIEEAGANYLHLDIMDGVFVPNISYGPAIVETLRPLSKLFFDVHLMIMEPIRYIDTFLAAGADSITVHVESCKNCRATLEYIKSKDAKAGLAISPNTPWEEVLPYLDLVDMILVMTVEPGFGGQGMIYAALDKVKALRAHLEETGCSVPIQVDGGINEKNVALASASGATIIVAGSAIFKAPKPRLAMARLREIAEENPYHA